MPETKKYNAAVITASVAIAVVVVAMIVVLIWFIVRQIRSKVPSSVGVQTSTVSEVSMSNTGSLSDGVIIYPETFKVPTETDIKSRLVASDWNALIMTYDTAGVITEYKQISGIARFSYDNGTDIVMELDWFIDSPKYILYDWRMNSSLDGYSAKYKNPAGDEHNVSIIPHADRIDISMYDSENALKRLIFISL